MRKFLRLAALFSCLGVLVLGAIALNPNGPLLSSFRGYSAGRPSLAEAIAQSERLARLQEAVLRRINAKEQIATEVIARRRSLAEAMEQFRALDQECPQSDVGAETAKALGISEDEWVGRGVIGWVRTVLYGRPDEAAAAVARLEKDHPFGAGCATAPINTERTVPRHASAARMRGDTGAKGRVAFTLHPKRSACAEASPREWFRSLFHEFDKKHPGCSCTIADEEPEISPTPPSVVDYIVEPEAIRIGRQTHFGSRTKNIPVLAEVLRKALE